MPVDLADILSEDLGDTRFETAICVFHQRFLYQYHAPLAAGPAIPYAGSQW